jgi:Flp pilus assembly protein TadD
MLFLNQMAAAQSADDLVNAAAHQCDQKNYDGAIAACTRAISLNVKNAWAFYVRAIAESKKSDLAGAISDFNHAIALQPKYAAAYAGRGNSRLLNKQYDEAVNDYNEAVNLEPENAGFRQSLGFIQIRANNYERAIAQLDKAVTLNPHSANAYNNRGYAYFKLGIVENNYRQAIADYDKGQAIGGSGYSPLFDYKEAAEAALKNVSNPDVKVLTAVNWLEPVSNLDNLPGGIYSTTVGSVPLSVKFTSTAAVNGANIQVLLNGKELKTGDKMRTVELKTVKTPPGANKKYQYLYQTTVVVPKGSSTLQVTYGEDATEVLTVSYVPQGLNLYVLAIGTNAAGLKYTQKDANDFAELFKSQQGDGKLFSRVSVEKLIGEEARAVPIASKINELSSKQYGLNDVLFVFISSHGFVNKAERLKVTGSDFQTTIADLTSIDFQDQVLAPLEQANCKKFIFLDACHSGAGIGGKAEAADVANEISKIIHASNSTTIITSSSGLEQSWENPQWQNGAFTKAIKEALAGRKGDTNGDGIVSMDELYTYIAKRVPELVKAAGETDYGGHPVTQTPKMYNPKGNVSIYVY